MKKLGGYLLLACLSACVAILPAYAELTSDTQQITLSTIRRQPLSKSVRFTTDKVISNLVITPSDLEVDDGAARIPANEVKVPTINTPLSANQAINLDIEIAKEFLGTSGEFTGSLLVQYDDSSQLLPITVRVKAGAWRAWLVLLAGVGLGTGLSVYWAIGLPKDELLVRVGKLRTDIRAASEPESESFKAQTERALISFETALSNQDWDHADASLSEAQMTWNRWLSGRVDWIEQIRYLDELSKANIASTHQYGQSVKHQLDTIRRQLGTHKAPQDLAKEIVGVRGQIERYKQGEAWLDRLSDLSGKLADRQGQSASDVWESRSFALEDELNALNPNYEDKFQGWLKKTKAACQELEDLLAQQPSRDTSRSSQPVAVEPLSSVPIVGPVMEISPSVAARRKLRLFRWASQLAMVGIISWIGMAELYETEATFGAAPISDYLGLFIWGFGAEVSRDAIVKALGDLKTPFDREKAEEA
ncbi:MAG: hypothetical protein AAGE59_18475 [Cyanobacteria bacterium P01_F01_bin.86]